MAANDNCVTLPFRRNGRVSMLWRPRMAESEDCGELYTRRIAVWAKWAGEDSCYRAQVAPL
jgi:hypothetical protein